MADSVYWQIVQAVQAQVANVVPNTVLRRKLQRLESDTMPICYVVPDLPGGEKVEEATFNKNVVYLYPVLVCYVEQGAPDLITGLQTYLNVREDIRQVLYQPLALSIAQVWDMDFDPDDTKRFGEFLGTNYDVAGWKCYYKSTEQRLT